MFLLKKKKVKSLLLLVAALRYWVDIFFFAGIIHTSRFQLSFHSHALTFVPITLSMLLNNLSTNYCFTKATFQFSFFLTSQQFF